MFHFFKDGTLQGLKNRLGEDRFEGIHEDGQSLFFHELSNYLFEVDLIDLDELRRYDLNIVQHWQQITEHRNRKEDTVLNMKYFQYLSLLFTEIYLDWYFNRKQQLLDGLNNELAAYNAENDKTAKDRANQFKSYILDDLNKLAYWNATVRVKHCYCMSIFCNIYIISRTVIPTITRIKSSCLRRMNACRSNI